MSLLTIIQDASDIIGVTRPTLVIGSTDGNVRTMLALAKLEGEEASERFGWPELQREASLVTLAAELQGVMTTIAPGYNYIINQTFWDRTLTEPISGPLLPLEWQALKARTATGPYSSYRIYNGGLYAYPAPVAGSTWVFEYQSKYYCQDAGGVDQTAWAADTDTGIIDETLMMLGVVWRFKKKNGIDYSEDFRGYEQKLANKMSRAGGRKTLNMRGLGKTNRTGIYIPDGNF